MKNKKQYLLFVILIVLIILSVAYKQKKSSFQKRDQQISLSTTRKIDRIVITSDNKEITLNQTDKGWLTEDNNPVNNQAITNLLKVLSGIQIQSSVSGNLTDSLKKNLKSTGINLKLYNGRKNIYNLTFSHFEKRNFVLTTNEKLYFVDLKAHANQLLEEFVKTDIRQWYDKLLINYNKNEIASVLIEYPNEPENSFKIDNLDTTINLFNTKNQIEKKFDPETGSDYLQFFSGIKYSLIDTTLLKPGNYLFRLLIITNTEQTVQVDGFDLIDQKLDKPDMNKFAGIINNSVMVLLNYSDFDPILVDHDYFLKK